MDNSWEYLPYANGTACDDGNACTSGDVCRQGACVGTPVCPPGSFTLLAPANGAGGINATPTLYWADAPYAQSYDVVITPAGGTAPVLSVMVSASTLVVAAGQLTPSTQYSWQVTARNAAGAIVAANGPFMFVTAGAPTARLDWYMPPRYGNKVNGVIVPAGIYDPVQVTLNACPSMSGFSPLVSFTFTTTISGSVPVTTGSCTTTIGVAPNASFSASVVVRDQTGGSATASTAILARDYLIVAMGDSYASGEGNPDVPRWQDGYLPKWQNGLCHRSANAPASLAALTIEARSVKSTVTFWSTACSGDTTSNLIDTAHSAPLPQIPALATALQPPPGMEERTIDMVVSGLGATTWRSQGS